VGCRRHNGDNYGRVLAYVHVGGRFPDCLLIDSAPVSPYTLAGRRIFLPGLATRSLVSSTCSWCISVTVHTRRSHLRPPCLPGHSFGGVTSIPNPRVLIEVPARM
jgi:hypothetical protein